jgi:hypothetical protein
MGFKNNPLSHKSFIDDEKQVLVSQRDLDLLIKNAKGGGNQRPNQNNFGGNSNYNSSNNTSSENSDLKSKVEELQDELEEIKNHNNNKIARKKSSTSLLYRPTSDFFDAIVIAGTIWFAYHLFFKKDKNKDLKGAEKAGEEIAESAGESDIAVDSAEMAELGAEAI